jgi:hypothetical protein
MSQDIVDTYVEVSGRSDPLWVRAVVLEGLSVREVAAAHGVSRSWVYECLAVLCYRPLVAFYQVS